MTLSREARILLGILLLAAMAWLWINIFNQSSSPTGEAPTPVETTTEAPQAEVAPENAEAPGVAADAGDAATPAPTVAGEEGAPEGETASGPDDAADASAQTSPSTGAAGDVEGEGPAAVSVPGETTGASAEPSATPALDPDAPVTVATDSPTLQGDIDIVQLPFLITEPPAPGEEGEFVEGEEGDARGRPSGQRASVNPFAPIIVAQAPAPPAERINPVTPTVTQPTVVEVPVRAPSSGTGTGLVSIEPEAIAVPAPRALTPPAPRADGLPRALPTGTLSATPDILRNTRVLSPTQPETLPSPAQPDLSNVAAIREPRSSNTAELPRAALEPGELDDPLPDVLGPVVAPPTPTVAETPISVGANALSRYLRDNNVRFTAAVLGPVGVGVFRTELSTTPVTLTLGQSFPETDFVLTNLKGEEAEFSIDEQTQTLVLDLDAFRR